MKENYKEKRHRTYVGICVWLYIYTIYAICYIYVMYIYSKQMKSLWYNTHHILYGTCDDDARGLCRLSRRKKKEFNGTMMRWYVRTPSVVYRPIRYTTCARAPLQKTLLFSSIIIIIKRYTRRALSVCVMNIKITQGMLFLLYVYSIEENTCIEASFNLFYIYAISSYKVHVYSVYVCLLSLLSNLFKYFIHYSLCAHTHQLRKENL